MLLAAEAELFFLAGSELDQVLISIGLIFITTGTLNLLFGPDLFQVALPSWLSANVDFGFRQFQLYRIVVLVIGGACFVPLSIARGWRVWAFDRRVHRGLCVRCRYDLRTGSLMTCPECGTVPKPAPAAV